MNARQVIHLVQPSEGENKEQSFFKLLVCSHLPGFKQNGSVSLKKRLDRIWITPQFFITVAEILVSLTFIQDYITSCWLLMALAKQSLSTTNEALGCLYRHTSSDDFSAIPCKCSACSFGSFRNVLCLRENVASSFLVYATLSQS